MKVLELFEKSTILRRMYYTAICCAFCYVVVKALPGVAANQSCQNEAHLQVSQQLLCSYRSDSEFITYIRYLRLGTLRINPDFVGYKSS